MFYVEKVRAWRNEDGIDRPKWVGDLIETDWGDTIDLRDNGGPSNRLVIGDWVVGYPSGSFAILSDADFRESYDPVMPPMVYMSYDPLSVEKHNEMIAALKNLVQKNHGIVQFPAQNLHVMPLPTSPKPAVGTE